jgi:hypothetical protein
MSAPCTTGRTQTRGRAKSSHAVVAIQSEAAAQRVENKWVGLGAKSVSFLPASTLAGAHSA